MRRWYGKLGLVLTGLAGIFGIRTPPDPQVIAQTRPQAPRSAPSPPERLRREGTEDPEAPPER